MPPRPARVFLIGMMGSGKTTVGKVLAGQLDWPYWDNDRRLHGATGAHVDEVAEQGPDHLHALEAQQAVLAALEPAPVVAGVAGSVVERTDLWPALRGAGRCVYLRARPETLAERVGTGAGRPWLADDPIGFLTETLRARGPLYAELADLAVDVDYAEPAQIAGQIANWLPRR